MGCKSSEPSSSSSVQPTADRVELARLPGRALARPRPLAVVVVSARGIGLDPLPLFAAWPPERKEKAARAAGHDLAEVGGVKPQLVPLVEFRPEAAPAPAAGAPGSRPSPLPALHDALVRLASVERAGREGASADGDLVLALRFDHLAPFPVVAKVVATVERAGYRDLELIVQSPEGAEVALPHRFPRPGEPACPGPLLTVFAGGVALRVTEQTVAAGAPPVADPDATPGAPTSWRSRLVVGADGACPSVPRREGAHDAERLVSLLTALRRGAPACARGIVTATASTPWSDLAPVIATGSVDGGLALLQLGEPTAATDATLSLCPGARKLDAAP